MKTLPLALALAALAACSHSQTPEPAAQEEAPAGKKPGAAAAVADASLPSSPPPVVVDAAAPMEIDAAPPVEIDAAPPELDRSTLVPSKKWPFYQWDEAVVVTFNLQRPGPGLNLFAYREDKGWNKSVAYKAPITMAQAKKAVGFTAQTLGGMDISKCALPRHAVVLLSKGVPVASMNVCFECGDILVWPAWKQDPNWEDHKYKMYGKLMKRYDKVFPKWQRFFEKDLGLATDWKKLRGHDPTP